MTTQELCIKIFKEFKDFDEAKFYIEALKCYGYYEASYIPKNGVVLNQVIEYNKVIIQLSLTPTYETYDTLYSDLIKFTNREIILQVNGLLYEIKS